MTKRKKKGALEDEPLPGKKQSSRSDESRASIVVRLPDNLTISGTKLVYNELSQHLKGSQTLSIDASCVQAVDTAGIQLLLAFAKEIARQDRPVEWLTPSSELVETVELLGLKVELGL